MKRRRRVDWSIILGAEQPAPKVLGPPVPGGMAALLATFDEIRGLEDPDAIIRRAVELTRTRIGLARVGIFLFDKPRDLMLGTWGSDLRGRLVDEHQIMYAVSDLDREAFRRAEEEGAHFTVFDDCPILEHQGSETLVSGRGWVAWTPILSAHARIGMLFNDPGPGGAWPQRRPRSWPATRASAGRRSRRASTSASAGWRTCSRWRSGCRWSSTRTGCA